MENKKTAYKLLFTIAFSLIAFNSSFGQVYMYCSSTNYSFQHKHDYLYVDADYDGYGGAIKSTSLQCTVIVPRGYSYINTDCNDYNASIKPSTEWWRDADRDGYGTSADKKQHVFNLQDM